MDVQCSASADHPYFDNGQVMAELEYDNGVLKTVHGLWDRLGNPMKNIDTDEFLRINTFTH